MSKRKFGNLLKRKFTLLSKLFDSKTIQEVTSASLMRNQFKDVSRLGQNLIVMRIGK